VHHNRSVPADEIDLTTPRWLLTRRLCEAILTKWSAEVHAIGVHGSLARGEDTEASDVNLVVVTYGKGGGPRTSLRRVDGILVDLRVSTHEAAMRQARELTPRWPLDAERWTGVRELHDPQGRLKVLREEHLARVAQARPGEFSGLARVNWGAASASHARAVRLAGWYETETALVLMAQARLHAALVTGLLTRTYYRNEADAVRRTGLAGLDMTELGTVLRQQAEELTNRGRPVDGPLDALLA
jgi:predicted nucleotidyltransferase